MCDEFPKVEPEVVVLSGQTLEEVQEILNGGSKEAKEAKEKEFQRTIRYFREAKPEPEVVALGGQTIEEVQEILKKSKKSCYPNTIKDEEKKCKLTFEEESSGCSIPDIHSAKGCAFKQDVDTFALWRKLALGGSDSPECEFKYNRVCRSKSTLASDVDAFALWRKLANVKLDDSIEPDENNPAKKFMDYILTRVKTEFPKLDLAWEEHWNPSLLINSCKTKISLEKLIISYQGLLNITEELNAQEIICNIIVKKIRELFI